MMDVNASLPPNFEWYSNQIAGHHPSVIRNGNRQIGILKELGRSDIILKLVQEGGRGQSEIELYQNVESIGRKKDNDEDCARSDKKIKRDAMLRQLYQFIPRFYGCRYIKLGESDLHKKFLQIEDITQTFKWPCIMDVKVGLVSYDPNATVEKKIAEESKSPLQKIVGFRILGYRNQTGDGVQHKDKFWGRERTEDNIKQAFEEYLGQACHVLVVVGEFLKKLERIHNWFEQQDILHFYASSLLFVYEGHPELASVVNLKMIDFSHAFFQKNGAKKDENYLAGLTYIIKLFNRIRDDLILSSNESRMIEKPNGMIVENSCRAKEQTNVESNEL